ncbi:beta-ketoacyl synthase N-terminal-like domain-containing protein, partial [Nocardia sp. NPDC058497]|uniref:beta-ketoacyl synthase N-terminal-like domain-containing protein n=1 Tax=Nocardia sp. NPDC058497 TaxID=3346529 RepID=UPI003645FA80
MTDRTGEHTAADAVAVIGMSCRFPMASTLDGFWHLLSEGVDAVREITSSRDSFTRAVRAGKAGWLDGVDEFDAEFFGMSPGAAAAADPRQRLMLELAWEAIEDAGLQAQRLRESATGVFVGASSDEYATLVLHGGADALTRHSMPGLQRGVIANRISYFLGLRGPSLTVDTAQSSSLSAVHLGCQSILSGESEQALVGGVSLNLSARHHDVAAEFGALSPDERCFTFDARANGFVRAEGGGMVVLKPLAAAVADGDSIYCVIRGSAVNNDGATDGLTRPNSLAQQQVIRRACQRAHIDPADIQYVELHGTGTKVGDPIEAAALGAVREAGTALRVGSVKTNIGHLDSASGIAGFIKTALSINRRALPASLHYTSPRRDLDLPALGIEVQETTGPWPRPALPLIAGVSSFGIGGTNCHVVLGEAPALEVHTAVVPEHRSATVVPLSARSRKALCAQAEQLLDWLDHHPNQPVTELGAALAQARSALSHRAAVVADDLDELKAGLRCLAEGMPAANLIVERAIDSGTVFTFPGQGPQWSGMALELLDAGGVFAETLHACDVAIAAHADWSVLEVLRAPDAAERFEAAEVVQPVLFAVMVALAAAWRSAGIEPAAVVGHSQGEVAAAYVAGALSLDDAARVVVARSRAVGALTGGGMAVVDAPASAVVGLLAPYGGRLTVAAVNGPRTTIVAGDSDALEDFFTACEAAGRWTRAVAVGYASHTHHVDAVRDRLLAELSGVRPMPARVPFYSAVTGALIDTRDLDADYWFRNLRQPVQFEAATSALLNAGLRRFVEISPHPVLIAALNDTLVAHGSSDALVVSSLRRGEGGQRRLFTALAHAHAHGAGIDWSSVHEPMPTRIKLPHYPFQRTRYWYTESDAVSAAPTGTPSPNTAPEESGDADTDHLALVRAMAAAVLGHTDPAAIDPDATFKDLGFDSVASVELCRRLSSYGTALPTTAVYDHPNPRRLADHLRNPFPTASLSTRQRKIDVEDDPVVITGMACRLPGGIETPAQLWALIADEREVTGPVPRDRRWDRLGYAEPDFRGGFLDGASEFDAAFFGISPREAEAMDPQQRLLLETAWEALESSGIAPDTLRDSTTGVFVGLMAQDYGPRMHEAADDATGYLLTGTATSVASGRIAYTLGTRGPALTVDTACSSSLVALHLAARSLRSGECEMALAGGATVMSTPGIFVEFSRQGGLAPDGRCKAFADAADGTAWSEGVGMLVLERRSTARQAGHPILAVLRGSAVNHDGASNGLTAPTAAAQESVLAAALEDAGLTPAEVDVIEGHGTGTRLGDPIEARALLSVYCSERETALRLGSLKSNIGHAQAAAGVAGVIKMVLAMRHGIVPRTLHVDMPSSHVDWAAGHIELATDTKTWPSLDRPRRAGVSSFGISGTNAHVIIEQSSELDDPGTELPAAVDDSMSSTVWPWVLSARSEPALREMAARLAAHVEANPELAPSQVGWSLVAGRTRFDHRAVVMGADRAAMLSATTAFASGDMHAGAVFGVARTGKTAWIFPGQGAQWVGMGAELAREFPVFAAAFDEVTALLEAELGFSVREVIWGSHDDTDMLNSTLFAQTGLFAVGVAPARLLEWFGLTPDMVSGHSSGEIVAPHV